MVNSSFRNDPQAPAAAIPARLIESGTELLRAEVALAMSRARQAIFRALTAVLATIVAAALLQVALVVGILSPLLVRTLPSESVWMAVALPALLALASLVTAAVAWSGTRRSLRRNVSATSTTTSDATTQAVAPKDASTSAPRLASVSRGRGEQ